MFKYEKEGFSNLKIYQKEKKFILVDRADEVYLYPYTGVIEGTLRFRRIAEHIKPMRPVARAEELLLKDDTTYLSIVAIHKDLGVNYIMMYWEKNKRYLRMTDITGIAPILNGKTVSEVREELISYSKKLGRLNDYYRYTHLSIEFQSDVSYEEYRFLPIVFLPKEYVEKKKTVPVNFITKKIPQLKRL